MANTICVCQASAVVTKALRPSVYGRKVCLAYGSRNSMRGLLVKHGAVDRGESVWQRKLVTSEAQKERGRRKINVPFKGILMIH